MRSGTGFTSSLQTYALIREPDEKSGPRTVTCVPDWPGVQDNTGLDSAGGRIRLSLIAHITPLTQ